MHFALPGAGVNAMMTGSVSEQPRVLFCCFDVVPGPSALSRRLSEYIKGLSDRFQVVVLSVKTADNSHIQRFHGARLLRVPVGNADLASRFQAFDRAVRRQLESEEYLLVHFFDPFGGYALCERRQDLGYRIVYDATSFPSLEMPLASSELEANRKLVARMRRQELFCLMNADAVVVGSNITKEYAVGLGVPVGRVHVLRAPVDLAPFAPDVMGRPDGSPMRLVHLGSEDPWVGLPTTIEALAQLGSTDVRFSVVGPKSPEEHAKLVEQVGAAKLEGVVDFQEPVAHDDIHKVLAATDVGLVNLADVERNRTVGGTLARAGEYLAAGRPVLVADLPISRELISPDAAVFYAPDDAAALAQAIASLAADPLRRVMLGTAARKAALAWDASTVRGALLDLYTTLAGPVPAVAEESVKAPNETTSVPNDAVTQLGARPFEDSAPSDPGTNKVKTDPAIATEGSTDPQSGGGRPAVMGTPLQEEPPVVVGEMLPLPPEARTEIAMAAVTDVERRYEPVVMGSPVFTPEPMAVVLSTDPLLAGAPATTSSTDEDLEAVPWADAPLADPVVPPLEEGSAASRVSGPGPQYPFTPAGGSGAVSPPKSPSELVPLDSVIVTPSLVDPRLPTPEARQARATHLEAAAEMLGGRPRGPAPQQKTEAVVDSEPTPRALVAPPPSSPRSAARVSPPRTTDPALGLPRLPPPPLPPPPRPSGIHSPPPAAAPSRPSGVQPAAALPPSRTSGVQSAPPPPPSRTSGIQSAPPSSGSGVQPPPLAAAIAARAASSDSGVRAVAPPGMRSSNSGVLAAPANALAGMPLPPISAPPSSASKPQLPPVPAPVTSPPRPTAPPAPAKEDVAYVENDEVFEVGDEPMLGSDPEDVLDSDGLGVESPSGEVSLPPSALDPWLAQLVHGYCPPESQLFARHVPPTTMPGRD